MVKYMHTHEPPSKPQKQQESQSGEQLSEFWEPSCSSRHASWGLGRDWGRAVSYPMHQESQFPLLKEIPSSGFCTLLFSTDLRTVSKLHQGSPHKLQAGPVMQLQGHVCQGVCHPVIPLFCLLSLCCNMRTCLWFWAIIFFPFILWYWNITNQNNILIFRNYCFYNNYLYFSKLFLPIFEIEMSSPCWCPTWYVTKDNIEFLILLSSTSECSGYGVCLCA